MAKIEHHLITIQITRDHHLHAFVMTNDRRAVEGVINQMFDEAEKRGCRPLPMVLDTAFGGKGGPKARKLVEQCLREELPEAWETYQRATDFHMTVWGMEISDPWDKKLMELH